MRVYLCGHAHVKSGAHRGRKALDPLELQLQVAGSCLAWMLGTELSSVRTLLKTHFLLGSDVTHF